MYASLQDPSNQVRARLRQLYDAAREEQTAQNIEANARQKSADEAAAIANPSNMTMDLAPSITLGAESAGAGPEDESLTIPGVASSPAPSADPRPALRRPAFLPPNPAQDMTTARNRSMAAGQAAAEASAPGVRGAMKAREAAAMRDRGAEPGLSLSPERVEADRAAAKASAAAPAPARSGADDLRERKDRARDSAEIATYRAGLDRHNAEHLAWKTAYDNAVEAGDLPRAEKLAAAEPKPPVPPQSVTGGLDENEVQAVWDHDNDPATPRIAETAAQSLDWLKNADPKAYARLQRQAQAAVGTDPAALSEWVSAQFGEHEPGERRALMQRSGAMLNANDERVNFVMPKGARGGIGDPGRPAAARAPEGKQALDPRTGKPLIVRDPFNAGRVEPIPVPGGGLLPTTRGNVTRAPQIQAALGEGGLGIDSLDTFPVNPPAMTPNWRQQMMGIGLMAFGLDREDFAEGPDGDGMFIAATQKLLSQHQQKIAAGFVVVPSITGGYTYQPGQALRDQQELNARNKDTNTFLAARPAINDTADADALKDAATPAERRQIKARLRQQDQEERRQALNDARSKEADQKNRENPARAPGMFRKSLAAAGNAPQAQAAVYRDFGMPREAERILAMENQRFAIEQAGLTERAKAEAEKEQNGLEIMRQSDAQIADGLLNHTDATRPMASDTAIDEYARVHGAPDKPLSKQEATDGVGRLLVQTRRPEAVSHPVVQGVLDDIYKNIGWFRSDSPDSEGYVGKREMFIIEAARRLNMDERTAGQMFDRRKGVATEQAPAEDQAAAGAAQ